MSANVDTFICGACHVCFNDLSLFVEHKSGDICSGGTSLNPKNLENVRQGEVEEGFKEAGFMGHEGEAFQGGEPRHQGLSSGTEIVVFHESENLRKERGENEGVSGQLVNDEEADEYHMVFTVTAYLFCSFRECEPWCILNYFYLCLR